MHVQSSSVIAFPGPLGPHRYTGVSQHGVLRITQDQWTATAAAAAATIRKYGTCCFVARSVIIRRGDGAVKTPPDKTLSGS